ncbi:MAG: hypothetical protein K2Y16_03240 [Burkholderiales bacterium]|nr:hypothetical protein [Burkholderiales bacterium]
MNRVTSLASSLGLAVLLFIPPAMAADVPAKKSGDILVNEAGMTLYTFDKDIAGSGKSVCNGQCAALWPPLAASADGKAGDPFSVIVRDDGARQWAYEGRPLYLYAADQKPGERKGDNVLNLWHIVKD